MRAKGTRRGGYLVVIALAVGVGMIATFVLGRSYSNLALQKEPFQRLPYVSSLDPVEDVTNGVSPNSVNADPFGQADVAIRAIEIYPTQILLLAGAKATAIINEHAPRTLHDLVKAVHRPGWISESGHTVTMRAAVVLEHGSKMTVAAPVTSQLVMSVRPGVFLAAVRATLNLSGVDIHASDTAVPTTLAKPDQVAGRPFVLASEDARMTVSDCVFRYLGRDWNSSYGLTWSKGSTGYVTGSKFEHDFIGVYSNAAKGLRIEHNQFYHNSLYGIDPHSYSSHLTVEYNTSDYNGRHGIIFSNHVTDSVVRHNVTIGNGLNGIMMDESSTYNVIENNTSAGNKSDGIVIANSSDNTIAANAVRNNLVGITVRGYTSNTTVSRNTITENVLAAQGTGLSGNTVYGNGGEWLPARIGLIWLCDLGLLLLLLVATVAARRPAASSHRL
jgi:mannuronan 5-epimerase